MGVRPRESDLYGPMVRVLGRLSGYRAYVGVPLKEVRDEVLRMVGIDPENSPWPLENTSSKKRDGLYRVVHFAWYHQTRHYRSELAALCAKPVTLKRGEWALTALGVERAQELRKEHGDG